MEGIMYKRIDSITENKIIDKFGDYIVKHNVIHKEEGSCSIAAMDGDIPVGFISTYPKVFPKPLDKHSDAYIDVIEVDGDYRRMGIARNLIGLTERWAKENGFKQIRAWSNNTKREAVPMWYALDYCICPAKIYVEWCNEVVDGFYVAKLL